jgi:hypothetical protein
VLSVEGPGFRFQGSGFRVQGSGFRVQGSGSRVQGHTLFKSLDTRLEGILGPSSRVIGGMRILSILIDHGVTLAYKKPPPRRTLQQAPMVVPGGGGGFL